METKYLQAWEEELNICIRCSYCFEGCPVFKQIGWEIDGPKGKLNTVFGLLTGDLEPSEYLTEKIYQCSFCRDCVEKCSANVSVPEILAAARADLWEAGYSKESQKELLDNIENSGNIFNKELKPPVYEEEKLVLLGCRLLERQDDAKRYLDILKTLGVKPKTFDETCCGMPFGVLGDKKGLAEQQEKFRASVPDKDEEIICLCTTCAYFIGKNYPDLKVKYVINEISERLENYDGEIKHLGKKLTYHDPCNLARGMNTVDEPREILKKIGVELVELPTHGKQAECCGGGGGLLVTDNPLAAKMATKRVDQALDVGVDTLVTLCPTCEFNIGNSAKQNGGELEVGNLLDLIHEAVVRE